MEQTAVLSENTLKPDPLSSGYFCIPKAHTCKKKEFLTNMAWSLNDKIQYLLRLTGASDSLNSQYFRDWLCLNHYGDADRVSL